MKQLKIMLLGVLVMTSVSVAEAAEKVEIKVKGMVCSFCAQGIKKKLSSNESISKVEVNLDDKWVKFEISDNKTVSDEQLTSAIKDAGYDVVSINRAPASELKK